MLSCKLITALAVDSMGDPERAPLTRDVDWTGKHFNRNTEVPISTSTPKARIGVSPGRFADHAAEIAALEARGLVRKDVRLDVAECRVRLALDALVEGLDDLFLEVITARMCPQHRISFGIAVLGI